MSDEVFWLVLRIIFKNPKYVAYTKLLIDTISMLGGFLENVKFDLFSSAYPKPDTVYFV